MFLSSTEITTLSSNFADFLTFTAFCGSAIHTLIALGVKTALEVYFVPVLTGKEHRNFLSTFSGALVISMIVILYAVITETGVRCSSSKIHLKLA